MSVDLLLPRRPPHGVAPRRQARILVVDDEPALRELIAVIVRRGGDQALCVGSVREALELLERERFDLVLSDLNMPGLGGLDLLAALSARPRPTPVLVVSGSADSDAVRAARLLGALAVVEKPFSFDALRAAIDEALAPGAGTRARAPGVVVDRLPAA